jgi:cytochrome c556
MHVPVKKWTTSAVIAAAVLVGSAETLWAQAAPAAPAPSAQAAAPPIVVYRKALMNSNTQHMAALRALTSGEVQLPDHIRMNAAALRENAVLLAKGVNGNTDLFPAGSLHALSRATPKIWQEGEGGTGVEFAWRAQAFQETATTLFQLAQRGAPVEQIREAVGRVQVTCGGCHASMRGPAIAATN